MIEIKKDEILMEKSKKCLNTQGKIHVGTITSFFSRRWLKVDARKLLADDNKIYLWAIIRDAFRGLSEDIFMCIFNSDCCCHIYDFIRKKQYC